MKLNPSMSEYKSIIHMDRKKEAKKIKKKIKGGKK